MNKNLVLLIVCQGLFLTNNVTFIAINGLVGLSLAPVSWMATLPVMGYVVGAAFSTSIVAKSQNHFGRKISFQLGLLVAVLSALLCAYAALSRNFWLLVTGTFIAGYYSANGQLYRFAAAELTVASQRDKAVSWVLAGGILGAVIGPNLASWTRNLFDTAFLGAYLTLSIAGLMGIVVMQFIHFPTEFKTEHSLADGRPLKAILKQPVFMVAVIGAALGYGVMNLLMAATPLAMQICGLPFSDTALVLEWHVIGMFAPGFFTGTLIQRFGALKIMSIGVVLNFICILIALTGTDLRQFLIALFLLGVGWNFLFTGSTSLAMTAYKPDERDKAQAAINFFVFGTMAFTSFGSGALITSQGWSILNLGSLIPVIFTALALLWLSAQNKKQQIA
ncbi:MFS transporter [Polynucleobacter sp. es-GGE-1]|uniref:MFS transporter n=1 Tax=unclassified Polynucleobacter TaxID=2640945 RepID=UPI001BFEDC6F|nr:MULTISPECIES: MFS transporter [unclassified Polynucleobacter]MBU3634656.1 MFS transporter [Polynucleobacter sp. es-GGE-1]QWD71451.1 MFS transporter [Polynucleobacter sp. UB-Siik-W21]